MKIFVNNWNLLNSVIKLYVDRNICFITNTQSMKHKMQKWILLVFVCKLHRTFSTEIQTSGIYTKDGRIYITSNNRRNIDIFHDRIKKYMLQSPNAKITEKISHKPMSKVMKNYVEDPNTYLESPIYPDSPYFGLENNKADVNKEPEILGTIIRNKRSNHSGLKSHKKKPKKRKNVKSKKADKHLNTSNKNRNGHKTANHEIKNIKSKHRHKRSIPGQRFRRLIAAKDATIEEYPYVISIQKNEEHWCSGAILNPRLSITTANCLWKSGSISRMLVRAGSRYTYKGGQMAKIQEVMKHPAWSTRKSPDNDLALILLDRNLKFSHSLHSVDLPNREMLPPFEDFWVTSFGSERRDGMYEPRRSMLQVYYARLMERESCNDITKRFGVGVTDNFICLNQNYKRAPCTRDTGAPAVSDGVIWGVASWGIRKLCGTERYPAMFSYTASHSNMEFILNATSFLMSDKRHRPFYEAYKHNRRTANEHTNAASNQYAE